jgi:aminoglycoside N3'-acetyltransferase
VQLVDDLTKSLIDLETKKSVHINLTRASHSGFRKVLLDYSLSMQEVFEMFATLIGEQDEIAMPIVREAKKAKREKITRRVTQKEAENLYDVISEVKPFER